VLAENFTKRRLYAQWAIKSKAPVPGKRRRHYYETHKFDYVNLALLPLSAPDPLRSFMDTTADVPALDGFPERKGSPLVCAVPAVLKQLGYVEVVALPTSSALANYLAGRLPRRWFSRQLLPKPLRRERQRQCTPRFPSSKPQDLFWDSERRRKTQQSSAERHRQDFLLTATDICLL